MARSLRVTWNEASGIMERAVRRGLARRYWDQIENYFRHRITNAGLEAINTKIQQVKRRSRGFRSRERFKMAIYFHCGGLDLYPAGARLRP